MRSLGLDQLVQTDIICGSNNQALRNRLFKHLIQQWKITDEGVLKRFVGLNFERSEDGLTGEASCGPYIDKIAKRFKVDPKIQETPTDAEFAVMPEDLERRAFGGKDGSHGSGIPIHDSVVGNCKPGRYVGTLLTASEEDKVPADKRNKLWGAADASYASDVITRRSHGGYMLFLNGGCVASSAHASSARGLVSPRRLLAFLCVPAVLFQARPQPWFGKLVLPCVPLVRSFAVLSGYVLNPGLVNPRR